MRAGSRAILTLRGRLDRAERDRALLIELARKLLTIPEGERDASYKMLAMSNEARGLLRGIGAI